MAEQLNEHNATIIHEQFNATRYSFIWEFFFIAFFLSFFFYFDFDSHTHNDQIHNFIEQKAQKQPNERKSEQKTWNRFVFWGNKIIETREKPAPKAAKDNGREREWARRTKTKKKKIGLNERNWKCLVDDKSHGDVALNQMCQRSHIHETNEEKSKQTKWNERTEI